MTVRLKSDAEIFRKLTKDLKHACAEAQKKADKAKAEGDGGTCNHDSVLIHAAVTPSLKAAVAAAGCKIGSQARKGSRFLETPLRTGQGYSNTIAIETVLAVMKDRGWDGIFSGWWQAD